MKETNLFLPIKIFLEKEEFEVFSEIYFKGSSRYVDVIGINKKNQEIIAIELKLVFNKKLIEQALFNASQFNYSYIALPLDKINSQILSKIPKNIGVLGVGEEVSILKSAQTNAFIPNYKTTMDRLFINNINSIVMAGEQIFKEKLTAKQIVTAKILNLLEEKQQITITDLVNQIETHWVNPKEKILIICQQLPQVEIFESAHEKIIKLIKN